MEEETVKGTQSNVTFALNAHVSSTCLICMPNKHAHTVYLCNPLLR